jgi:hypothetical protein
MLNFDHVSFCRLLRTEVILLRRTGGLARYQTVIYSISGSIFYQVYFTLFLWEASVLYHCYMWSIRMSRLYEFSVLLSPLSCICLISAVCHGHREQSNKLHRWYCLRNLFFALLDEWGNKDIYPLVCNTIEANQHFRGGCCPCLKDQACFILVSCLAYSLILKMGVSCISKMSVDFQQIIWYYFPEDRTLHNHHCENLGSYANNTIIGGIYPKYKMVPKTLLLEFLDTKTF